MGFYVRRFLDTCGPALQTVTSLDLKLEDTGTNNLDCYVLLDGAAHFLGYFPNLQTLRCSQGRLLGWFVKEAGSRCPNLATLDIAVRGVEDDEYVQEMLQLQLSFIPQINKLILRGNSEQSYLAKYTLPDFAKNVEIVVLEF